MTEKIEIKEIMLPLTVLVSLLLVFVPPILNNPIPRAAQLKLSEMHFNNIRRLDIISIELPTNDPRTFVDVTHYVSNSKTLRDDKREDRYPLMMSFPGCFMVERREKLIEINMCAQTEWEVEYFELLDYMITAAVHGVIVQYPKKMKVLDEKAIDVYSKIEAVVE
jgi:hypothetical protein